MYSIGGFWRSRFSGTSSHTITSTPGWDTGEDGVSGFVEPSLCHRDGADPNGARIVLVAAPGAVGKSTYASQMCASLGLCKLDLARAGPVAEHSFIGGATRALGNVAPSLISDGKVGVVIDALDEAQLRVTPESYEAFLSDVLQSAPAAGGPPIVLFGRSEAVEYAWLYFSELGEDVAVLQIEFFNETQSKQFVEQYFSLCSVPAVKAHEVEFVKAAVGLVEKLRAMAGESGDDAAAFSGYAPVLDAVCTAISQETNPAATAIKGDDPVELLINICNRILDRETRKICDPLSDKHGAAIVSSAGLYSAAEQRQRLWQRLFGRALMEHRRVPAVLANDFDNAVTSLFGSHPFLDGSGRAPANSVFGADLAANLLLEGSGAEFNSSGPSFIRNPFLFSFYEYLRPKGDDRPIPLEHVGVLHASLVARTETRQHVNLLLVENEYGSGKDLDLAITAATSSVPNETTRLLTASATGKQLQLYGIVSHVTVDAESIEVQIGNEGALIIEAPTYIHSKLLTLSGTEMFVRLSRAARSDGETDVVLRAEDVLAIGGLEQKRPAVPAGVNLTASWPGAKSYPWTDFATDINDDVPADVAPLFRRLRKLVVSFRSHSRGALKRLADKIEHRRMLKNDAGQALMDRLLRDNILDRGKFFELDPQRLADLLDMDYNRIRKSECSKKCHAYLASVLAEISTPETTY